MSAKSLVWKILHASYLESIFCRDGRRSESVKSNRMKILANSKKKIVGGILPFILQRIAR
jgi:hypothetical protein